MKMFFNVLYMCPQVWCWARVRTIHALWPSSWDVSTLTSSLYVTSMSIKWKTCLSFWQVSTYPCSEHKLHKPQLLQLLQLLQLWSEGVTLVTNMVINMFVPASVTIAKLFVTSLKRSDSQNLSLAQSAGHRWTSLDIAGRRVGHGWTLSPSVLKCATLVGKQNDSKIHAQFAQCVFSVLSLSWQKPIDMKWLSCLLYQSFLFWHSMDTQVFSATDSDGSSKRSQNKLLWIILDHCLDLLD